MPGKFMKGALVQFMPTVLVPLPNVIAFQFNPETIQHSWTQPKSAEGGSPLAVKGMPGESFGFTIVMDANDQIASGNPMAKASGIYSRLAALEMLMYPTAAFEEGLLGSISVSASAGGISASASASAASEVQRTVPKSQVTVVLFVWGPARIVPVRVTSVTITEQLYDTFLNPTHAEARLELQVLTPDELNAAADDKLADIAKVAYGYSQGLRQAFALANLANTGESIAGMIPV